MTSEINQARYDRQLRLWGDSGQSRLNQAKILIIGDDITALESAKSLILPGVGSITIIKSSNQKTYQNFFHTIEDLQQLNPTTKVTELSSFPHQHAASTEFLKQFTIVLQTDVVSTDPAEVSETCYKLSIPYLLAKSFGQIGILRLSLPNVGHLVLDSHAEYSLPDLRLDCPRKEYTEFLDSFKFEGMKSAELSHVPFPVILSKCWSVDLNKETVRWNISANKYYKNSGSNFQNFEEALASVNKYVQVSRIPSEVMDATSGESLSKLEEKSDTWYLLKALGMYIEKYKCLPISGVVEDMHSDTDSYVKLQKIYRGFGVTDSKQFEDILEEIAAENKDHGVVDRNIVQNFVKKCSKINISRTTPFHEELANFESCNFAEILQNDWQEMLKWYIVFHMKTRKTDSNFEDILKKTAGMLEATLTEFERVGLQEIHTVAAITGASAAQEIIKIVTKQYTPIPGIWIYDGVKGKSASYSNFESGY